MNSIVRERAARRIYVAYMNIKYEYQRAVLAACCSPLPQTEEGRGHNVPIPCAGPAGIAHGQGKVAARGLGSLQKWGKTSLSFPLPLRPIPSKPPTGWQRVGAISRGAHPAGAVLALGLPRGPRTPRQGGDSSPRGPAWLRSPSATTGTWRLNPSGSPRPALSHLPVSGSLPSRGGWVLN